MSELPMWVIYENPKDVPNKFVARKWLNDIPQKIMYIADSLDEIRKRIPEGLVRMSRSIEDDPIIVEIWL